MKTLITLCAALSLISGCAQVGVADTISKADILKTVQHLQQRCHEAEDAQAAAQKHAQELQGQINEQSESLAKMNAANAKLGADNTRLAGERDKALLYLWEWRVAFVTACVAFGVWTFRKPLLALCGAPIP